MLSKLIAKFDGLFFFPRMLDEMWPVLNYIEDQNLFEKSGNVAQNVEDVYMLFIEVSLFSPDIWTKLEKLSNMVLDSVLCWSLFVYLAKFQ